MKAETGANIQIQRNVPNPMPNMTTIFIFAKSYPQCDSAIKLIEGRIGPVVHVIYHYTYTLAALTFRYSLVGHPLPLRRRR